MYNFNDMFNFLIKKFKLKDEYREYNPEIKSAFWFLYFKYSAIQLFCFGLIEICMLFVIVRPNLSLGLIILYAISCISALVIDTSYFKTTIHRLSNYFNLSNPVIVVISFILYITALYLGYQYYIITDSPRVLFMCLLLPFVVLYSLIQQYRLEKDLKANLLTRRVSDYNIRLHLSNKIKKYPFIRFLRNYTLLRVILVGFFCENFDGLDFIQVFFLVWPSFNWVLFNDIAMKRYSNSNPKFKESR